MLSCLSHARLFATPWTVAHQAPLSTGFSRQEYWSGLLCPPPGDLPNPGIKPGSPALQVHSLLLSYQGSPHKAVMYQLSRKFGNNSVGYKNLKLDDEYNLFVKKTLQINRVWLCLLLWLCFSLTLSGDSLKSLWY